MDKEADEVLPNSKTLHFDGCTYPNWDGEDQSRSIAIAAGRAAAEKDIEVSVRYYVDSLGFEMTKQWVPGASSDGAGFSSLRAFPVALVGFFTPSPPQASHARDHRLLYPAWWLQPSS
jgi:hypothetical protein